MGSRCLRTRRAFRRDYVIVSQVYVVLPAMIIILFFFICPNSVAGFFATRRKPCRDGNLRNTKLSNAVSSTADPLNMHSKLPEYQCSTKKNMDLEIIKKDFVNASSFINKAKKLAREADIYLNKLSDQVLPRCQSTDITSNIMKRNVEVPSENITQRYQHNSKEHLDKNINKPNDKSKTTIKLKSVFDNHVYSDSFSENLQKTNNYSQQLLNNSTNLPELTKTCKNNVGIVNLKANIPDEKENDNLKIKNLTVQQIPRVDLKPDLVTQKLANIQIKPDSTKNSRNYKRNTAYYEFAFELEPEICKCKSLVQPITNDKIVARHDIRRILCGMLDNVSSNSDSLNDHLICRLLKIMEKLEETNLLECNMPNELHDLVEEHSLVGFSETIIKKRLLEIVENLFKNVNNGNSFDQMAPEIGNNSHRVLDCSSKIKNKNSSEVLPHTSNDKHNNYTFKFVNENSTNCLSNNIFQLKNLSASNDYISVREFLLQPSNNIENSKMYKFKNLSVVKTFDSQTTLSSKENILNHGTNTQRILSNENNTSQSKTHQLESKNQDQSQTTSIEDFISVKHLYNDSNILLKTPPKSSEEKYKNKNNNNKHHLESENENESQFTSLEDFISSKSLSSQSKSQSSTQEWILNSLSLTSKSSNNNQFTDLRIPPSDKKIEDSSTSTKSLMMKQRNQEIISDAESSVSLGEVDYISRFHNVDSNSSIGEIKN